MSHWYGVNITGSSRKTQMVSWCHSRMLSPPQGVDVTLECCPHHRGVDSTLEWRTDHGRVDVTLEWCVHHRGLDDTFGWCPHYGELTKVIIMCHFNQCHISLLPNRWQQQNLIRVVVNEREQEVWSLQCWHFWHQQAFIFKVTVLKQTAL